MGRQNISVGNKCNLPCQLVYLRFPRMINHGFNRVVLKVYDIFFVARYLHELHVDNRWHSCPLSMELTYVVVNLGVFCWLNAKEFRQRSLAKRRVDVVPLSAFITTANGIYTPVGEQYTLRDIERSVVLNKYFTLMISVCHWTGTCCYPLV